MNVDYYVNKYNAEYISSHSNVRVVLWGKLNDKKNRDENKLFLAEGIKLAGEALAYADVDKLIVAELTLNSGYVANQIIDTAHSKGVDIIVLADHAFEKISTEKAPQGVIAVTKYLSQAQTDGDFSAWQENKRLIMLDGIRDPGNLGTIIRSAEALGVTGVILHNCADIYNNKTIRAAMGSLFRIPIYVTTDGADIVRAMKSCGRRVLGASLGEHTLVLGKYDIDPRDCPVIGNEGHGISTEILNECDYSLMIPMAGNTESLNAAQAATCILWEYHRINI